jgi:DNA-binding transcriptional MerR regulator
MGSRNDKGPELSTGDVARVLGCSVDLVRHLERNGKLRATLTPSGRRQFTTHEVERAKAERDTRGLPRT